MAHRPPFRPGFGGPPPGPPGRPGPPMFRPPVGAPAPRPGNPHSFARPPPNTAVVDARKRAAEAASKVLGADVTADFVYQARREQEQAEQFAATQRAFEHQHRQQQMAQAQAGYSSVDGGYAATFAQSQMEIPKMPKAKKPKVKPNRGAGGEKWFDPTLDEWDPKSYRIFCGDLGKEVNDDVLGKAFKHYPSFQKARVVRNVATKKSKGYGFVAFADGKDYLKAMKEMQGKYIGNRPVKLRKSNWDERNLKRKDPKKSKGKKSKK
eukprot:TRINITY_DN7490_c0_g3_i2.p1 TRINITY_DN7490_c0_g3~~TRINITY_DN7490_c0_g3_i2.p1  ORF type:complete len:265 (+),score=45.31 TRINITY_DN7490_c0_g3_i2:194-988(+)